MLWYALVLMWVLSSVVTFCLSVWEHEAWDEIYIFQIINYNMQDLSVLVWAAFYNTLVDIWSQVY